MNLENKETKIGRFPTTKEMFDEYVRQQRTSTNLEPILMQVLSEQQDIGLIELMHTLGDE